MRSQSLLPTAAILGAVAAGPLAPAGALSQDTMAQELMKAPWLLPPRSFQMFKQRYEQQLQKRQETSGGMWDTLTKLAPFIPKLPGMLAAGSTSPGTNPPVSKVAEKQEQKAITWSGAQRVKVRYGPYRIPPVNEKNLESEFWKIQGMSNNLKFSAKRPCDGECTLLSVTADLEYADGSAANNSNGAWFHHAILLNSGMGVVEPTCQQSLVESIFLVGNERTEGPYALKGAKIKSGYKLRPSDSFILNTELMNLDVKEKWVWPTITYEYLPGPQPEYKNGKTIWMTIGDVSNPGLTFCDRNVKNPFGPTNLTGEALPKSIRFSEHSKVWKSGVQGHILKTAGHLHEGATGVDIFQNDKLICSSNPTYSKEAFSPMAAGDEGMPAGGHADGMKNGHSHGMRKRQVKGGDYRNSEIEHIASQGTCDYVEGIPIKKGDTMHIRANYDFDVHKGLKNKDGVLDQVMGIVGVLVAY